MKKIIILIVLLPILASCSKVTQKRLEGIWKVREINSDVSTVWSDWLDTSEIKVGFYQDGTFREFYYQNELLAGFTEGTYLLLEESDQLTIAVESMLFNTRGYPFEVTSLHRSSMTLEGRYFVSYLFPSAPADSVVQLTWKLEK